MEINIRPVQIGDEVATTGVVSVAVSDSVAVRVVPTVDGVQFPEFAVGLVGTSDVEDAVVLMAAVQSAVQTFASGRGV